MADQFSDAIAVLKADHRKAEDLFQQVERTGDGARKQKFAEQICNELKIHTTIEEQMPFDGMFTQCPKAGIDLVAPRDRMLARKQALLQQAKGNGLPAAKLRLLKTA